MPGFWFQVTSLGNLSLWWNGHAVALIDISGEVFVRRADVPVFWIEYLLMLPRPEHTQWN